MPFPVPSHIFLFQAGGFLVSAQGHVVPEERELDENVNSRDDYMDTASLLEQVFYPLFNLAGLCQESVAMIPYINAFRLTGNAV